MREKFLSPSFLLGMAIFVYMAVFLSLSIYKYQNYLYNLEDLSIFNNVLYNTAHGKIFWFSPHGGFSYLGDHLELGLLLLLPVYYFFQSPLTLLFFHTLFFALSAWPLFLIARQFQTMAGKIGRRWLPLFVSLVFLLNPFVHNINLEEFHIAPLLLFFFFWTFYFYLKKNYRSHLLFFLLTLLLREDAALTLGALAVLAAWENRRCLWREKKWWLYPGLAAALWFVFALKIISWFNPDGGFRFLLLYQHLSISNPLDWLARLLNFKNLVISIGFLTPLLFLPLYCPRYLFLLLPALLQVSLLDAGATSLIYYIHHQTFILAALFLSLGAALVKFESIPRGKKFLPLLLTLLVLSQIYISFFFGPSNFLTGKIKNNLANLEDKKQNEMLLSSVPPSASLSAGYRLMPKLSSREKAYLNKLTFLGKKHLAYGDFFLPDDTEYLLIDAVDMIEYYLHFTNRARYSPLYWEGAARLRQTIARHNFQPFWQSDSLIAFLKNAAPQPLPFAVSPAPASAAAAPLNFGPIELISLTREKNILKLWWRAKQKINDDYFLQLSGLDAHQQIFWQKIYPPAYGLLPTHDWPTGQIIKIIQPLPADLPAGPLKIALIKIKGDIELGALNDTQLTVDKKEILGEIEIKWTDSK